MTDTDPRTLRYAVLAMAGRYGDATQQYAYAINAHADVRAQHLRAAQRRYRALHRLTDALTRIALQEPPADLAKCPTCGHHARSYTRGCSWCGHRRPEVTR